MLQEMGVTVWGPAQTQAPVAQDPAPLAPPRSVAAAPIPATPHTPAGRPPPQEHTPPQAMARMASPAGASTTQPAAGLATAALRIYPAQALYPSADPAQTPPGLGGGWLIVAESLTPADPLGGDAGRLLDNMLRAMQLHRHPRVFLAALERPGPGGGEAGTDIATTLADTVATLRPAMVLVLGHVAARAALGRTEPLGRLRAGPHQLAGCPAVVTYDPAFLLRSQDTKAAVWADLCRALALVRSAA
ncbi:DNA polymerase [Acidovorax sp. 69]|nr:DNA polymerase [Acidovorax sp. 69]